MILEIEFASGFVYQYFGVIEAVYEDLMKASSHGEFFNTQIKGVYPFSKV